MLQPIDDSLYLLLLVLVRLRLWIVECEDVLEMVRFRLRL